MPAPASLATFSVPVSNEDLYRDLQRTAERLGRTIGELVESAIAHELDTLNVGKRGPLQAIANRLATYQRPSPHREAEVFAHAEVTFEDPLVAQRVQPEDLPGLRELLGGRLE